MSKNKKIITIVLLIIISIVLFFIFSYLLKEPNEDYNNENIIGNSYLANDNSYLVLNKDKTFYWYKDKDNKEEYYYGVYTVYRGENAIKFITSDLSIYDISEKEQRDAINNSSIPNAIDHYYLINLNNEKSFINGKEEKMFKETRYYGFATEDYKELDFVNIDANNYAIFILE